MTTLVGTQAEFKNVLIELAELDYDAVEAYKVAIEKVKDLAFKTKLKEFQMDHERHITEINRLLEAHNLESVKEPSMKQWLTKGKVALADMIGDDNTILKAMFTNEEDTNTAYDRANNHADKWPDAVEVLRQGLLDERKHKDWIKLNIK